MLGWIRTRPEQVHSGLWRGIRELRGYRDQEERPQPPYPPTAAHPASNPGANHRGMRRLRGVHDARWYQLHPRQVARVVPADELQVVRPATAHARAYAASADSSSHADAPNCWVQGGARNERRGHRQQLRQVRDRISMVAMQFGTAHLRLLRVVP